MSKIKHVSDSVFKAEVLESDKPVAVDFWAPWCAPCRMTAPVVEAVSEKMGDKIKFVKLDTNENPKTAVGYNVMAIPSLLVFQDGKEVHRIVGFLPEDKLEEQLAQAIGKQA